MKLLRASTWLPAALPCTAVFLWCSLASRFPEPVASRRALGECTWRWDLATATTFDHEPVHVLARLLGLVPLQVPGVTNGGCAFLLAVLATLLTFAFAGLLRTMLPGAGGSRLVATAVIGMLVCSPAHGANWLHVERLGRIAVPLTFVAAAGLLAPPWSRLRGALALACATAAPFWHDSGVVVFLALLPLLIGRAGAPWIVAWVLLGNVAAAASLWPVEHLCSGHGLGAALGRGQLLSALGDVVVLTGGLWPDVLPGREVDAWLLGVASWASPLLLLFRPRPHDGQPTPPSAPAFGLIAFGLLLVLWHVERCGLPRLDEAALAPQARRELLFAGLLLPIGVLVALATRVGAGAWLFGGGALAVLAIQGWDGGREALRAARWQAEHVEATVRLPVELGGIREQRPLPTRDLAELLALEARGLVLAEQRSWMADMAAAIALPPDATAGVIRGGDRNGVVGTVCARVFGPQYACIGVAALVDGQPVGLAFALPDAVEPDTGRVNWQAVFRGPLPEGAEIVAVGYDVRGERPVRLAGDFVVRDGRIGERAR